MAPCSILRSSFGFLAFTKFFLFHSTRTEISASYTLPPNSAGIICPQQSYSETVLHMCGSRASKNQSRIQRCYLIPSHLSLSPHFSPMIVSAQIQSSEFSEEKKILLFFFLTSSPTSFKLCVMLPGLSPKWKFSAIPSL